MCFRSASLWWLSLEWGAISNCWYLALGIAAVTCMPESKTCRLVVIELLILFQYPWEIQTCAADSTKTKRGTSKLVATRYMGFHHARKVLPKTPDAENIGFLITPFICQNLLHIKSYRILSYQICLINWLLPNFKFYISTSHYHHDHPLAGFPQSFMHGTTIQGSPHPFATAQPNLWHRGRWKSPCQSPRIPPVAGKNHLCT